MHHRIAQVEEKAHARREFLNRRNEWPFWWHLA